MDILEKYEAVKSAVDKGKQQLTAAESELKVNKENYDRLLGEIKEKYGISSYEALVTKVNNMKTEISRSLLEIENNLKAGGLLK